MLGLLLRTAWLLCALVGFATMGPLRAQDDVPLPIESVVLESAEGGYLIAAEVASSPRQRERGLMFRHRLPPDRGMLFIYERPQALAMWMRNTYISLDMIFIGAGGLIYHIEKNTKPLSEAIIGPPGEGIGVLEVAAGTADRIGLAVGDKIIHQAFDQLP